jgi:hypothetical protein
MPYTTIRASLTVSSADATRVRELLESAIDQLAIRNIPVNDINVVEECGDPPADPDRPEGQSGALDGKKVPPAAVKPSLSPKTRRTA